ncbi:hypothetical protein MmiAt1_14860 [Methanimicrococcus sp. At1]|uniref:YkgJ family cysteine cluster protein n=1 Tax=Methanimicrococcus hacksteinii TaxID=3028293 RepID=A0ABU3VSK6_9EURY|nr:YkgJ family cysteine cluster protein [Methanimicrococcus sp. At1]MDV0445885.1 hypothetical protein [Methanimicrococcus sp. At1]
MKSDLNFGSNPELLLSVTEIQSDESVSALEASALQNRLSNELQSIRSAGVKNRKKVLKTIENSNFVCLQCGQCCRHFEGDNTVYVLPDEIQFISESASVSREQFVLPLLPDFYKSFGSGEQSGVFADKESFYQIFQTGEIQTDADGRIHTFGWMLQKKKDGSCIFLDPSSQKCLIYDCRPGLCRTYPFYSEESEVFVCECEGIGKAEKTDQNLTEESAEALLKRALSDHEDYLKTSAVIKEKYEQFIFDTAAGKEQFEANFNQNRMTFVVYDSTGICTVQIQLKFE